MLPEKEEIHNSSVARFSNVFSCFSQNDSVLQISSDTAHIMLSALRLLFNCDRQNDNGSNTEDRIKSFILFLRMKEMTQKYSALKFYYVVISNETPRGGRVSRQSEQAGGRSALRSNVPRNNNVTSLSTWFGHRS